MQDFAEHFNIPTTSNQNRAVQPQKMARDLKFRIQEVDYCTADLRLCFSHMQK